MRALYKVDAVGTFRSTPPRGGRPTLALPREDRSRFDPRPRVGGDFRAILPKLPFPVSIHAPAWGATTVLFTVATWAEVSIHAPAWGATAAWWRQYHHSNVSIHAPAWGATSAATYNVGTSGAFRSTPPRGGRRSPSATNSAPSEFRSTPPRGGRQLIASQSGARVPVSIHAPAWGATCVYVKRLSASSCFDPRPRVGGDYLPV